MKASTAHDRPRRQDGAVWAPDAVTAIRGQPGRAMYDVFPLRRGRIGPWSRARLERTLATAGTPVQDPAMTEPESALQAEIGQSRPFLSPAQEATISILRTADVVRRQLAIIVSAKGLTHQQYNVLRILRGAHPDPLPTLEIRSRMIERSPGITRFVDHLERKGLVRRERDPRDRRRVQCYVTDAGLKLLASLDRAMDEADEAAVRGLSSEQTSTLITLLSLVRRGAP